MRNAFLILPLILLFGCGSSSDSSTIFDLNSRDSISITDFVDHIDIVQLESNSQSLLSNIAQLIFYNDNFYIRDSRQQALFCFSKTGDFKYKISSIGRGPEEYSSLGYFNIDPYNDRLMLLAPFGEILYFDLNGKFIKKTALPSECKAYNEVYAINKETLIFVSAAEFNFVYYSWIDNKIIKNTFPINPDIVLLPPIGRTYQYKDSIYFNSILNENEIYNVSANIPSVRYKWHFGNLNYTRGQIENIYQYIKEQQAKQKPVRIVDFVGNSKVLDYFINNSFETNRYRIAQLTVMANDSDLIFALYDKNKKSHYIFSRTTEGIQLNYRDITNESIVLWNYAPSYDYKYYEMSVLNAQQREIIHNHNEEQDNPFLVIYHLKQ